MLQATLEPGSVPSTNQEALASYVNLNRLEIKPKRDAGYRLVLSRIPTFTSRERELAGHFIDELAEVVALNAGGYQPDLIRAIPHRVVARHLGGGQALLSVLERLETWSSQTYEGQRIVASIGLDDMPAVTGISLDDLWDEPFGPVMTNGFDTLLVVGSDSDIQGVSSLSTGNVSRTAPYRLREIACWTTGTRIAAVLNQHGEILVFQDQSLRFARRSGNWQHYVHETNIKRMSPPHNRELREAIYESCLDVSFARTGGGIGVVSESQMAQVANLVSADDLLSGQGNFKTRLLSRVVGGVTFQALDRRARAEMLSLDGAMILDRNGRILAAGAIIDVPPGSVGGGGRTAAARRLSTIGLGVKVSQDGTITGFRDDARILKS
ncbi:MAG: hypothetical protein Q7J82_00260 [Coriobacteriia bacterium]|nr:hypothetical protein [Coriobacteriia bacterium]